MNAVKNLENVNSVSWLWPIISHSSCLGYAGINMTKIVKVCICHGFCLCNNVHWQSEKTVTQKDCMISTLEL